MRKMKIEYTDEEGEDVEVEVPCRKAVCSRCEGEGKHVNPAVDGHGITAEEWERDWDDESRAAYFAGAYDVTCEECEGRRVVDVPDPERFTVEDKAHWAAYQRELDARAEVRQMEEMERRYGA